MKYNCDFCGREFNIKPNQLKRQKTACCSRECASKLKAQNYKGENNPNFKNRGELSPFFKGERIIKDGYYMLYVPEHPLSNKNGRIREHRYIAENYLASLDQLEEINGVWVLSPVYDVHHKDGNKLNNSLDNLEIITRQDHAFIHQKERSLNHTHTCICEECGKTYIMINSRTNNRFCSIECMNKNKHNKLLRFECPVCGNIFFDSQKRICCSVECSNVYRNRGSIEIICDNCGKKVKQKKSRAEKSKTHFCCKECYYESKNKNK